MRCAAVALLFAALVSGALAASAGFQVLPSYGEAAIYEEVSFNAEVLVTPGNSYDSSRISGVIYYAGSGGERINLGSVFGFVAGSASAGIYASATLAGIPKAGTYELTLEGTVEHLGYFNSNSPDAVWGRPESFKSIATVTVYEQSLGDQNAALSNVDNQNNTNLELSTFSFSGNWFDSRTIKSEIHQSFTTGTQQTFLDKLTIRDREGGDAPIYYVRLLGPSMYRLLIRGQKVGEYYTEYGPTDGVLILQPNTKYWIVMEPYVVPPFSATFDATSDRLNHRSSLGWVVGETLLVTRDSGGYQYDGGYEYVYVPPSTTTTISAASPLFSIAATLTGGYDGFPLEGAASRRPFNPADATKWSAGGAAWTMDRNTSNDGLDSAKAQTTDGQATYREYTVTGPAVVDFWWKVSSEKSFDTFTYSLNGVSQETISGEVDWTYRTLTLPEGTHTIRWTYAKDESGAIGQDAGWLDEFAVYPATATLRVRDGVTLLDTRHTVDFGSTALQGAAPTKTLTFSNEGYVPLEVQLSLPEGSPFTFENNARTYDLMLGRGESADVPISLATDSAGTKTALLSISAPGSSTAPPIIALQGILLGQKIGVAQGGNSVVSGRSVDMGLAPRTLQFTLGNTGNVGNLVISQISATGNFQIIQQPQTTIAPQGSTSFTVLAQAAAFGSQSGVITINSNDPDTPTFTISLSATAFAVGGDGIRSDSMATSGSGGAVGWGLASTQLPSGVTGQALKTGTTPNNGGSVLEFTSQTAGVVKWSWKVSTQEEFDWLLCEVDGQEAAGISTKNGIWQTQVVNVPAGANIRWVYRKDGSGSIGEDAGYLADVEFRSFAANQSFSQWAQTHGIYDPQQRMPKSGMQAMFGWLGGFGVDGENTDDHHAAWILSGRLTYRYPISKTADGTQQILFSSDMSAWTPRRVSQRILSEDGNRMVVEATAPSGTKGFFKVSGGGDTSMVWVQGGLLPQSSELAGTAVATFQIGKTEVTWAEWQEVRLWGISNGYSDLAGVGEGSAEDHPVRTVRWIDAVKWCNAKSEMHRLQPVYYLGNSVFRTGQTAPTAKNEANGYRLPSEAEWEWAAGGGVVSQGYTYSGSNDLNAVGWYFSNATNPAVNLYDGRGTFPAGRKMANELGIHDMSGNVWEWCFDPIVISPSLVARAIRGSSFAWDTTRAAVAYRAECYAPITYLNNSYGFRLARNAVD